MNTEQLKANLNLYAVLPNLEDLVQYDDQMAALASDWNISIQFTALNGPSAFVEFNNGTCRVRSGKHRQPTVSLLFLSPAHLNRMFDGRGNPIPLKGFTRLSFLKNEFSRLSKRLEYYLKPEGVLLTKDPFYLELNTRLTLNTAAFSLPELAAGDVVGRMIAPHIADGVVLLKVLPEGPAVHLIVKNGVIRAKKGDTPQPMAMMLMKDLPVAGKFLNNQLDVFSAVACGDIRISGQMPMLDAISLILDRIPSYLA